MIGHVRWGVSKRWKVAPASCRISATRDTLSTEPRSLGLVGGELAVHVRMPTRRPRKGNATCTSLICLLL